MKITQYLPNFLEVKGVSPEVASFTTKEELLNIPWVNRWQGNTEMTMPSLIFHQFSLSASNNHLIAEFNENEVWFVVGIITGTEGMIEDAGGLNLPNWETPKTTINWWVRDTSYRELDRACFKCSSAEVTNTDMLKLRCMNRANAKVYLEVPRDILECADVADKIQQLRNLGDWSYHYKEVSPAGVCDRFSLNDLHFPRSRGPIPGLRQR